MKIGIIIHSQTGHTLSVAEKIREGLLAKGHTATIERITASNESEQNVDKIDLTAKPRIDGYDLLIFGAPVHGFALSAVMQAYLRQLQLQGSVSAEGFVTQFFPSPMLGGNQSIKGLRELCSSKGIAITKTQVINWVNPKRRQKLIEQAVDALTAL